MISNGIRISFSELRIVSKFRTNIALSMSLPRVGTWTHWWIVYIRYYKCKLRGVAVITLVSRWLSVLEMLMYIVIRLSKFTVCPIKVYSEADCLSHFRPFSCRYLRCQQKATKPHLCTQKKFTEFYSGISNGNFFCFMQKLPWIFVRSFFELSFVFRLWI